MRTLKYGLEKPTLIWLVVAVLYFTFFWTHFRQSPLQEHEQASLAIIEKFAHDAFPPTLGVLKTTPDWGGHLGWYVVMGQVYGLFGQEVQTLRVVNVVVMLAALLVFVYLGYAVTYRNRLNPLWISLALVLFAANPYSWLSAFRVDYLPLLCLSLLLALYCFEREQLGFSALFSSFAVLVDWRALVLPLAFLITRLTGESSKLLRPERMIAFILPFFVGALPLLGWKGIVPEGEARANWQLLLENASVFRIEELSYLILLLPLYSLYFSWAWAFNARSRSLVLGAIWSAVLIPAFFFFPMRFDLWNEIKFGLQVPRGYIDLGALMVAGQYKNLVLFVPWLAGVFLVFQLIFMDALEQSRSLRYFILISLLIQPFVVGVADRDFLIILPFVLLLSLSEALVGEEGKLA
ncbi:MAG: hypothetical protein AB1540_05785 [Bdellovibrionota bacterium]